MRWARLPAILAALGALLGAGAAPACAPSGDASFPTFSNGYATSFSSIVVGDSDEAPLATARGGGALAPGAALALTSVPAGSFSKYIHGSVLARNDSGTFVVASLPDVFNPCECAPIAPSIMLPSTTASTLQVLSASAILTDEHETGYEGIHSSVTAATGDAYAEADFQLAEGTCNFTDATATTVIGLGLSGTSGRVVGLSSGTFVRFADSSDKDPGCVTDFDDALTSMLSVTETADAETLLVTAGDGLDSYVAEVQLSADSATVVGRLCDDVAGLEGWVPQFVGDISASADAWFGAERVVVASLGSSSLVVDVETCNVVAALDDNGLMTQLSAFGSSDGALLGVAPSAQAVYTLDACHGGGIGDDDDGGGGSLEWLAIGVGAVGIAAAAAAAVVVWRRRAGGPSRESLMALTAAAAEDEAALQAPLLQAISEDTSELLGVVQDLQQTVDSIQVTSELDSAVLQHVAAGQG